MIMAAFRALQWAASRWQQETTCRVCNLWAFRPWSSCDLKVQLSNKRKGQETYQWHTFIEKIVSIFYKKISHNLLKKLTNLETQKTNFILEMMLSGDIISGIITRLVQCLIILVGWNHCHGNRLVLSCEDQSSFYYYLAVMRLINFIKKNMSTSVGWIVMKCGPDIFI